VLTPDTIQSGSSARTSDSTVQPAGAGVLSENLGVTISEGDLSVGAGTVSVSGFTSLSQPPTISFSADWTSTGVQASVAASAVETSTVTTTVSPGASGGISKDLLPQPYLFAPIPVAVGPVPVVLVPELQFELGGSFGLSVGSVGVQKTTESVVQQSSVAAGLDYDNGQLTPTRTFSSTFSTPVVVPGVSGDAQVSVGPVLTLALYGVAGPDVNIDGFLDLSVQPTQTPWWVLSGGLQAGAGLNVPFLNLSVADPNLIQWSEPIVQASGPLEAWSQAKPTSQPEGRDGVAMDYDAATAQVVLFGGLNAAGFFGDTWTWDGTNWQQQQPSTSPPPCANGAMVYDPATGQVVLFGGLNASGYLGDTWTWDGTNWQQQQPSTSPPAREFASMAYDPSSGKLVLFGGNGYSGAYGGDYSDTWTWDGTNWQQQHPSTSPPPRAFAAMATDTLNQGVLLFGGYSAPTSSYLGDTWVWTGSNWTQQFPTTSPAARQSATASLDGLTGGVLLFGGFNASSDAMGDTWLWDGTNWDSITPVLSPEGREFAAMATDKAAKQVVLFGGFGSAGFMNDTWLWGQ
jgi:hypothetical protein